MSTKCPSGSPPGHSPDIGQDDERTIFGQCLDALRDTTRTPRARGYAGAPPVPSRPVPSVADPSGSGLFSSSFRNGNCGPTPSVPSRECVCAEGCRRCEPPKEPLAPRTRDDWTTRRAVWHHLAAGLSMLGENDFGRPWPAPRRDVIARLVAEHDADLCISAARETREIVCAYDRAPNITGLFEKKLRELAEVRATVREALA